MQNKVVVFDRRYKTRVYEDGEVTNKPDAESIRPGQRVKMCSRDKIDVYKNGQVKLLVKHPQGISSFILRFYFNDRIGIDSERDLETFRKMVEMIMEPMPTE